MVAASRPPLYMVTWRCTRTCNGNCLYCSYAPQHVKAAEVNTKTAYKIVDEVYDFGSPWFGISGGEPMLRPDIFDITAYAKEIGFEISLITSGFVFDKKRLYELARNEVHTAISVDGNREANDAIRGRGAYDKALFAMKRLSENGLLDCVVTTMTKYNIKDVEHTVKLASENGAKMVVFHNIVPVGRAGSNMPDLAPSPEDYEWALNEIYDLQVKYQRKDFQVNVYCPFYARIVKQRNPATFWDWYTNQFLGKCTIGGDYIGLTENGDYRPCGFHEGYRIGNVKDKSLRSAWNELQHSEFHLKLRDKSNIKGKCGVCEYREICGGCRTRAEYYTGDLFQSDPACAYIPKVLREDPTYLERMRET